MIQPIGPRLLVRPIPDEFREQLSSGLYLPETSREKPHRAVVVRNTVETHHWAIGDIVIYGDNAGIEIEDDYETLLMLMEHEILCGVMN